MYGDCKRIQDNEGECTMIKMSEMYRISGGCRSDKTCRECMNYVDEKHSYCLVYPKEFNGDWDGSRIACKYYTDAGSDGQMDIRDYCELLRLIEVGASCFNHYCVDYDYT